MMSSAAAGATPFPSIQEVAANATLAEREHFQALWQYTLVLLRQGIIGYFLPRTMAIRVGYAVLKDIAKTLSNTLETDIYISFEIDESAYYIGQIFDETYLRKLFETTSIHRIQFQKPQQLLMQKNSDKTSSSPSSGLMRSSTWPAMDEKIPKPRNMWIIYRQDKHNFILAMNPGMHTSKISSVISAMWRNERAEVRDYYKKLAEEEKANHRLQYPDYKCSPRKPSEIKKRKRSSDNDGSYLSFATEPQIPLGIRVPEILGSD